MKKMLAVVLALVLMIPVSGFADYFSKSASSVASIEPKDRLTSTEDFIFYFNFYGAFGGSGHELSIKNAYEYTKTSNGILYKTIFNECEILSLDLSLDAKDVKCIYCTWAKNVRGATNYLNDFLQMLMVTLLACGMESDSVSLLFTRFGEQYTFNAGDKGDMTIDGINISYEVTSYAGVTFVIKRSQ